MLQILTDVDPLCHTVVGASGAVGGRVWCVGNVRVRLVSPARLAHPVAGGGAVGVHPVRLVSPVPTLGEGGVTHSHSLTQRNGK